MIAADAPAAAVDFDAIHKLPRSWRYLNISVLWIAYFPRLIRVLYRLGIRHEAVTLLSFACGTVAAFGIAASQSFAGFLATALLVHLKDLFDACDGALARLTGTGHRLGRFLDTIGDGVIFTLWIVAAASCGIAQGQAVMNVTLWAVAAWFSLFLQCSYFNFHQLHYIRLSGVGTTSHFDERCEPARGTVGALARVYDVWFGWQDRLISAFDVQQRRLAGLPSDCMDNRNDRWYAQQSFMIANSALCFGTHALVLIVCLIFRSPYSFLPAITIGMNLYWLGIVLARFLVFRGAV